MAERPVEMPSEEQWEALVTEHARVGACPPPEQLFAWREGVLPPEAAEQVGQHSAACQLCQTLLASADDPGLAASAALRPAADARLRDRLRAELGGSRRRPQAGWWRLSLAAAALLVVIGLATLGYRRYRSASTPQLAVAGIPELQTIATLAPPAEGPALVERGASVNAGSGPSVADLLPAFEAYNRGDFAAAGAAFRQLAGRFPTADIPPLYLGVSELKLQHNSSARTALQQAYRLAIPARHNAAAWYLAVAELRLQQPQAALPLLQALCAQAGDVQGPRACELEQRLEAF